MALPKVVFLSSRAPWLGLEAACLRGGLTLSRVEPAQAARALSAVHVVLLDGRQLPSAGADLCRLLKGTRPTIPVVVLLAAAVPELLLTAFEAGADDCLSDPVDERVLVAHLNAVLRRYQGGARPARRLRAGQLVVDLDGARAALGNKTLNLTVTEFAILEMLVRREGSVVRRADIIETLRCRFHETLSHTVETHIYNLRRKLGARHRKLIETVSRLGYRLSAGR